MKLDILAFAAHPDDAELSCTGTLLRAMSQGKKTGIVDLTRGENGTRGTAETRQKESELATSILGIHVRENLGFADGFFENNKAHQLEIIRMIRKYKPEIVFANALADRHPDHGRAAKLVSDACFLAALTKVETHDNNVKQEPWRPKALYHYIQDMYIHPSFVVDVTEFMDKKVEAIKAFKTQFYDPSSTEPNTYISSPYFLDAVLARASEFGKTIGARYAEGFTSDKLIGVDDLFNLR